MHRSRPTSRHPGTSYLDSQLGLAVRRWCAPVLGLDAHAPIDDYLARRSELGWREATTRLLRAAGLAALLVDTGLAGDEFDRPGGCSPASPGRRSTRWSGWSGWPKRSPPTRTPRASPRRTAPRSPDGCRPRSRVKSIIAYRYGLAIPADGPPSSRSSGPPAAGCGRRGRLTDPVLLRFVLWAGVDTGLPLQIHTGFGDRDLRLPSADPALLQPFLAATEATSVPVVLLHCYPYHRQAGWLSVVYPHVYVDVGLTMTHLGPACRRRARGVRSSWRRSASCCSPPTRTAFRSCTWSAPRSFGGRSTSCSASWLADDAMSTVDAHRMAEQICAGNAARIYRL